MHVPYWMNNLCLPIFLDIILHSPTLNADAQSRPYSKNNLVEFCFFS